MTAETRGRARQHLKKAHKFVEAAEAMRDDDLTDVVVSNAVVAAVNAKDAICLHVTGRTGKSDHHQAAIAELDSAIGRRHPEAAKALAELLRLKNQAQYDARSIKADEEVKALRRIHALVDIATTVLAEQ